MAMVRPARSTPPYALIIFIFLWLVSTAGAIVIYIQFGKQVEDLKSESTDLNAIADRSERGALVKKFLDDNKNDSSKAKRTALGQADAEIQILKSKIGNTAASVDDLVKAGGIIEQALRKTPESDTGTTSLLTALNKAIEVASREKTRADTAEGQIAELNTAYETAKKEKDSQLESARSQATKRGEELKERETQITDLHTQIDNNDKTHADKMSEMQRQQESELRKLVAQNKEAESAKASIQAELEKIKSELAFFRTSQNYAFGVDPVGKIIRVTAGENEVWINLGRKDHISPGMTFAVYDPKVGASMASNNKGKRGDIEVIEVGEGESLARISHTENKQPLLQNDVISNPVYSRDKNRKFHFLVMGNFDIDGDGVATPGEREKIVRLVQSWGGVIDEKVSSQTDFLVVGAAPALVASKVDADSDQGRDLIKQSEDQAKSYQERINAARDLSIPVLNANRFLSMIGYYNPTVSKY